jgi:hypothetical protein
VNLLLLSLSLLGAQDAGQSSAPVLKTSATTIEVTAAGASEHVVYGSQLAGPSTHQALTTAGNLWTHTDGGAAWIARDVSIGNLGTQVFAEYDLNNEAAEVLSAFDVDPATPIWTDVSPLGTEFRNVASAADVDVHVAANQTIVGSIQTREVTVRKFRSRRANPDWTYTFTPLINGAGKVAISDDGSTIVAAIINTNTSSVEIAVLNPNNGNLLSYTVLPPAGNGLRGFDLSEDGSTLYFSQGVVANLFDIATQTIVFSQNIGAGFDSHAISGDGSVFAFGNFNSMRVWAFDGSTYVNTQTHTLSGQVYCAQIDISADSSTLAYAWYYYNPGLNVRIDAMDVATGAALMTETINGQGGFQNLPVDVSMNADGSRFAVGLWGDAGTVDEVRVYSSSQSAPTQTLNLPGSVFDLDMSADGQRVAVGSKSVHANTNGNGGQVNLLDAGGEDLTMLGSPRIGTTPSVISSGPISNFALLITSPLPQSPPLFIPGAGTLYVHRQTLSFMNAGISDNNGTLVTAYPIAADPLLIGTNVYMQAIYLNPRVLTADYLKITILP